MDSRLLANPPPLLPPKKAPSSSSSSPPGGLPQSRKVHHGAQRPVNLGYKQHSLIVCLPHSQAKNLSNPSPYPP